MEKKIFFSLIFMGLLLFISSCEQDETISPSNKEGTYVCTPKTSSTRVNGVLLSVLEEDYNGQKTHSVPVSGKWKIIVARQGGARIRVRYDINDIDKNFDAVDMGATTSVLEEQTGKLRIKLFSDPANSYIRYHLMVIQVP